MNYLIIGEEYLINKEIDDIIKSSNISSDSIIKYNLSDTSIERVIEELNTYNLFQSKKIVICYNIKQVDNNSLISYLKNSSDNILIMVDQSPLDERKAITKAIKEYSKIIDVNNIDMFSYVKNNFTDYKIDNMTIRLLLDYTSSNYNRLKNEIEKLKLYKLDERVITIEDVKSLVKRDLETNIFKLADYINQRNKKKALETYYDLMKTNEDEYKIIGLLASNYRLMYQIKTFGLSNNELAKKLTINPVRVKIAHEKAYNYSQEELEKYLLALGEIDQGIKSGLKNKKNALELFLTKI